MKRHTLLIGLALVAACQLSFGQTDTNVIAVGDWSAPATNDFIAIRGRLIVYGGLTPDTNFPEVVGAYAGSMARVYLELQAVPPFSWAPVEVYFDRDLECLHVEMRDDHDKLIPEKTYSISYLMPSPFFMVMVSDSTIRVRVDMGTGGWNKPHDREIFVAGRDWLVSPDTGKEYYLSATFKPLTNSPSAHNYHLWQGTLELPKVKIPIKKK